MKEEILTEASLAKLVTNTNLHFPTRADNSVPVRVDSLSFTPMVDAGILRADATTSSKSSKYETTIEFMDVDFNGDGVKVNSDAGEVTFAPIPKTNDVKVRCTCLDFYYRFATWLDKEGALIGNPPEPYVPKTNREPVNPDKIPALCKHLIALSEELESDGIVS